MMDTLPLAELTLLRPLWLLALPLALLAWWIPRQTAEAVETDWDRIVDARLRPHVLAHGAPRRTARTRWAAPAALIALVLAMAGPAVPSRSEIAYRADVARALIFDLSEEGPAATALQLKLLALLQRMPPGETALIVYGEEPYLVAPPTTDVRTLQLLAPELTPDIIPLAGHRPERALRMAEGLLARSGMRVREILWFSTQAEAGTPALAAIAGMARSGIRVSVLTTSMNIPDAFARSVQDTGGLALALRADHSDLENLLAEGQPLASPSPVKDQRTTQMRDLGPWLVLLALPLLAITLPAGTLMLLLLPALLLPAPAEAAATDPRWQAVEHYRAGRYAAAAAALEPFDDADSLYNRGTALARLHRLPEALAVLAAALAMRPDDPDIRHNHDLVRALLNPPPPPPPPPPSPPRGDTRHEAQQLAEQWMRRVPDEPAGLLRRKLRLEHERRQRGEGDLSWR